MPNIRADFERPASLAPESFQWVRSPQPGVERVMLDRVGDEVAVATSLVRYAARSRFPAHAHPAGEEFLVLEGEFGDEHGRFGPGTYVRNPPGTRHTPFSDPGCVIWVKLRQFHPDDRTPVTTLLDLEVPSSGHASREVHTFEDERVTEVAVQKGATLTFSAARQVQEVLIIDGRVRWNRDELGARGWLRVPAGAMVALEALAPTHLLHKTRPAFAVPDSSTAKSATSAASAGT